MIIESIKTGLKQTVPAAQWEEMRRNGDSRKYRVVSHEAEPEIEVPKVDPVIQNVIQAGKTVHKPVKKRATKRTTKPKKAE